MSIFIRNLLKGTIKTLKRGELNSEIEVLLPSGQSLIAMASNETCEALSLAESSNIVVLVKSNGIIIAGEQTGATSARNHLTGSITHIERGAVDAVVTVSLGGVDISADITLHSVENLALTEGQRVSLLFKASNVILGSEQTWLRELFIQRRVELGLSQRALAQRLGIIYSVIAKVENGEKRLDVFEFINYCKALDIDPISTLSQIHAL